MAARIEVAAEVRKAEGGTVRSRVTDVQCAATHITDNE
jgi:hypothetical protein